VTAVLDLNELSPEDNRRLNELAIEIREEFNSLVESVGLAHETDIDWMVSSIASRNKYLSPLFERCCQLALVDSVLESGRSIAEIRTRDRALSAVLRNDFKKKGLTVAVVCTERVPARLKRNLKPVYHWTWACVSLGLRCLGRSQAAKRRIPRDKPITLLDTFVLKSRVGEGGSIHEGKYRDRYFPGLLSGLSEEERESIFYCPGFLGFWNPLEAFGLVRGSTDRFIIPDDLLTVSDYLYCLSYPARLFRLAIPPATFRGHDMTSALRQERRMNSCNESCLLGLLNYRFAFRVSEANIRVRLLVDWHENQLLDRGLIAGFRRFQPSTSITGYQGYIVATNLHIYVRPTAQECRAGAAPHRIAVIGRGLLKEVREWTPDCEAVVAPAFRFDQVWKPRKSQPEAGKFTALVGLPIGLKGSREILELLIAAQRKGRLSGVRFWLKPHPTVRPERIEPWLDGEYLSRDHIKTGNFEECIEGANVLIGNASSTCVEALAKGVPVIVVGVRLGINENPIPADVPKDMWRLCTTVDELIEGIQFFQRRSSTAAAEYGEMSRQIREEYFEPVTGEGIRRFLQIDGGDRSLKAS
jgi:hypothetical protein